MVGRNILEHPSAENYSWLCPSSKDLNLKNFIDIEKKLAETEPDLIIHCAGRVGGIQANMSSPVDFLVDNLEMGKNLILAAKKRGIRRVINLGSSCMYPRNIDRPLVEEQILSGELEPTNEGYALAKILVQRLCSYINQEDDSFSYKTLVPCNLYGRWDKFGEKNSHMLPAVIKKIHEAKINKLSHVEIWGSGNARREFLYAQDLADFIFFMLEDFKKFPDLLNVGLGHDYSVKEYYQAIAKVIGYFGKFEHDLSKPEGMKRKVVSTEKLGKLNWQAKTSLIDGIKKTYNFYLKEVLK